MTLKTEENNMTHPIFNDIIQDAANAAKAATPAYIEEKQEADQKTYDWFKSRIGFFNASETCDLMKQGRGKGELWGATAIAVIDKVIIERSLTDEGLELYIQEMMYKEFRATNWGNKYEGEARAALSAAIGGGIVEVSSVIHPDIPYFRGSSDGVTINGIPVEIKCPYNILKHQANLRLLKSGITGKHQYYAQIQSHMMIHEAEKCYFASYDPRRKSPDNLAWFLVNRDEVYIKALRERLEQAEEMAQEFLLTNK